MENVETTRTSRLDLKIFHLERSTTKIRLSMHIECRLCGKKYELLHADDYSWIRSRLKLSEPALMSLKSIYGVTVVDLDDLFKSVTSLTKVSRDRFHICIDKFGIKSYTDCHYDRKRDRLMGVSAQRLQ